jgi:hypothetical protein
MKPGCGVACPRAAKGVVREPPEREYRVVLRGYDVGAEPRAPELDEGRVLPAGRPRVLDSRMDRQQRGARHGILQTGPRSPAERLRPGRQPFVKETGPQPEREDLKPRELEPRNPV